MTQSRIGSVIFEPMNWRSTVSFLEARFQEVAVTQSRTSGEIPTWKQLRQELLLDRLLGFPELGIVMIVLGLGIADQEDRFSRAGMIPKNFFPESKNPGTHAFGITPIRKGSSKSWIQRGLAKSRHQQHLSMDRPR